MLNLYTRLTFTFVLSLLFVSNLNAQILHWAKSIGGVNSDIGHSIVADAAGNIYNAGAYQNSVDFDPGSGTTTSISNGSFDIFITKFDANGNFVWVKSMGGLLDDRAYSIALDASGNIYTTGYFKGTVDFDPSTAGVTNLTSVGVDDMFILKLNSSGNFVWVKQIGGTDIERGKSISIDAAGNILTTGYFAGTTDFDPSSLINTMSSAANTFDIFVLKLNSNGDYVWAKKFGVASLDEGHAITTDASGNVYVTGEYDGTVDFDPSAAVSNLISAGAYDVFVLKLDANGALVWAKGFGGQSYDSGAGIAVDIAGNVYTTGLFGDVCDFDPGVGTYPLTAAGGIVDKDIFVCKLSSTGSFVWAKRMGGTGDDWATGIALDGSSNVYTTGVFHATADFDPGTPVVNLTTGFGTDIYISKLDATGNYVFAKQVGGSIDDDATSIAVNSNGTLIYVTGEYEGTNADFDPGAGVANLTSLGSYDAFILKLGKFGAGINDQENATGFDLYPNPSTGLVTIKGANAFTNATLTLVDILGNEVYNTTINNINTAKLDLSHLPTGVYMVRIQEEEKETILKLVKN